MQVELVESQVSGALGSCPAEICCVTSGKGFPSLDFAYNLLGSVASREVNPEGRAPSESSKGGAEGVIKFHDLRAGHPH